MVSAEVSSAFHLEYDSDASDADISLTTGHAIRAVYASREYAEAGGLMSYGASDSAAYRRAGSHYVPRILKGAKPSDLPVEMPTKYELVISVVAAKALGLDIPPKLLALADEVIE